MLKKLFISGFAIGALTLSANPVKAASFTLDEFNKTDNLNTIQKVKVGRSSPAPRTSTLSGIQNVFGGSRTLKIDSPLQNPNNLSTAAELFVDPSLNKLDIINNAGVVSKALVRYDGNGAGLHTLGLGNWGLEGKYDFDYFAIKINSIQNTLDITFKIEDSAGQIAQVKRTVTNNNGTVNINNPNNPELPVLSNDLAIFAFTEFSTDNNINFNSVKAAQIEFTGLADADVSVDYIQGVEIPEPSLGIGTIIVLGIGLVSVKKTQNYSEDDNSL